MDLPFQAHVRGGYAQWEPTFHYTRVHKGTAGGFAVQFSAAKDSQTAADTQALAGGWVGGWVGAAVLCMLLLAGGGGVLSFTGREPGTACWPALH